jgi:hypothetical protein
MLQPLLASANRQRVQLVDCLGNAPIIETQLEKSGVRLAMVC